MASREAGRAVREVEVRMKELARNIPAERARFLQAYLGTALPVLGLPVPVQRAALRRGYSFGESGFAAQLAIWDGVWRQGRFHETMAQALMWAERLRKPELLLAAWPVLRAWTERVDCWDLSDGLSATFGRALDIAPARIYPTLKRWNRSRNPWLRRQSIVALLCTARARRNPPPPGDVFPLLEARLDDPDRFVQKGIGWALREAGYIHPEATRAFVADHAARLSAIAFAEATRKMPDALRRALKARRTRGRNR